MSYGVKYRLEFTDDNEKDKKIEILKKNYSSTVLPLIGTSEPCIVTWDSSDDFYSPIKGSTCTLNLFVTDTVSYDEFHEFDEREYQVKISYKDSSSNYQTYWIGWLVVDTFSEAITSKPFEISLTAFDGLGSLDGFDMPLDQSDATSQSGEFYLRNILNNIELDLDIYVSNDIKILGKSDNTIFNSLLIEPYDLMKDKFDINNAKHVLEQILKFTNSRIFQSFGRWYIINNSSYSEQSVKTASASTASGGSVPTGIRASESTLLINNGTESIKFRIHNNNFNFQSDSTVNVLSSVPTNLIPLENSLVKEYLRPLNVFRITHNTKQFIDTNQITNSGFENGTAGWTTYSSSGTTSPGSLSTDFAKQGNQSYKNTQVQTNETGTRKTISTSLNVTPDSFKAHTLKINTYFDTNTGFGEVSFRYQIRIDDQASSPTIKYWNNNSSGTNPLSWVDVNTVNIQEVEEVDVWDQFEVSVGALPIAGLMTIDLYEPYVQNSGGLNALYYDNITLNFKRLENNTEVDFFAPIDELVYSRQRTSGDNLSGVLELTDLQLSDNNYQNATLPLNSKQFVRPRDNNANFVKSMEQIVTQQVINDYRTNVVRYEGKLYNLQNDPIALKNKIWINFGASTLREPVSCYIDGMTYNVKKNTFDVIMHIPNQNDDQSSDFKASF